MKRVRRIPKLTPRADDAHKGDFGRVLVVAGSATMLGAAVLCARAVLRAGAGLARVALPADLCGLLPLAVPEATTCDRRRATLMTHLGESAAVVVGPGLTATAATRSLVESVLELTRAPIVLDADALNVVAPLAVPMATQAPVVMTPHPGEAARLLEISTDDVQGDRPAAAAALAQRSGAVIVLKGAGTLVCDGARLFQNRTGNPGMATAGSGDVLSGVLGALLARGLAPFEAACLAVHVHGAAGDRARAARGVEALIASDICDGLGEVLPA